MRTFVVTFGFVASAALAWAAAEDADSAAVRRGGLVPDAAFLIDHFRGITPTTDDERGVAAAIKLLADPVYDVRQRAARELIQFGPKATPALQRAMLTGDAETVHRARDCLQVIEREHQPAALASAVRILAREKHPSTPTVLLRFLPFAEPTLSGEIREVLGNLASDQKLAATMVALVKADQPMVRASAAEALLRAKHADGVKLARPLLADGDPCARFRVSAALATVGQRDAVPTLIGTLPELTPDMMVEADEFLCRLAGDDAPDVEFHSSAASVKAYQSAWQDWWQKHGAAAKFTRLTGDSFNPDRFWLAVTQGRAAAAAGTGMIAEANFDGTIHRKIEGLSFPVAFDRLSRGRMLVAEYVGGKITERDAAGKVLWEKSVTNPVAVQRLAGGHVFIAARNGISITDRAGKEIFSKGMEQLVGAMRRRDGTFVTLTTLGTCQVLDANGEVRNTFTVGRPYTFTSIQELPGGRILIPEYAVGRVAEYSAAGREVWRADCNRPTSAYRLPNGRTLVTSTFNASVIELDANGQRLRAFAPGEGLRPLFVRPALP